MKFLVLRKFLLLLLFFLAACSTSTHSVSDSQLFEMGNSTEWFENADPEHDAVTAIGYGDLRLIALALRSLSVPGVVAALKQGYIDECGFKLVPGVDDVIRNENDLRYLQVAREYALAYNSIVVVECASAQ